MHILAFREYNRAIQGHRILSQRMLKSLPDVYDCFKYIRTRFLQVAVFICGMGLTKDILSCITQLLSVYGCDWNKR